MKKAIIKAVCAAALVSSFTACATAPAQPAALDKYDFQYIIQENALGVTQVFDDGQYTYIQMKNLGTVPAVFVDNNGSWEFAPIDLMGQYIKVPTVSKRLMLKLGNQVARIMHTGDAQKTSNLPDAAIATFPVHQFGETAKLPDQFLGGRWGRDQKQATEHHQYSYSSRMRGDKLEWTELPEKMGEKQLKFHAGSSKVTGISPGQFVSLAKSYKQADRVELIGYDDRSDVENLGANRVEAVANALAAAGLDRSKITTKVARQAMGASSGVVTGVSIIGHTAKKYTPPPDSIQRFPHTFRLDLSAQQPATRTSPGGVRISEEGSIALTADEVIKKMTHGQIGSEDAQKKLTEINTKPVELMTWEIKQSDGTVKESIDRWAKSAGYEVVFDDFPEIAVTGTKAFESPDFVSAINFFIDDAKKVGYVINSPQLYTDNVLVFGAAKE